MNKFEQISSFGHQMSLAGGHGAGLGWRQLYNESPYTEGAGPAGSLYGEVQCIMSNGHMGPPWPEWRTDTSSLAVSS